MARRICGFTALLAMFLAPVALLVAWSELHLAAAATHLDNYWSAPTSERVAAARAALARAGVLPASRGEMRLREGQLALIDAFETRRPAAFLPAMNLFQAGIAARPLWPDGHAWLAVAGARAGRQEDAAAALNRSLALGPRAGRLLTVFAPHVAPLAAVADQRSREAIFRLADRVAIREPAWTAGLMRRFGWGALWCSRETAAEIAGNACRRMGRSG